ncbi:peroxidase [Filobacillus milosensis]|uniref:Peroxidase n=3 Tax=Filobacillus milosensis TaxID=94137 RepID=A0A4Y8IT06_9BACI|nr:peroxidase [Filobacillus milosensis]
MLTKDELLVKQLKKDYKLADLDDKTIAILTYAVKLTLKPHSVTDEDVIELKEFGCSDLEVLDVCQIASYFNFVNRIAEGLGVKLEKDFYYNS